MSLISVEGVDPLIESDMLHWHVSTVQTWDKLLKSKNRYVYHSDKHIIVTVDRARLQFQVINMPEVL